MNPPESSPAATGDLRWGYSTGACAAALCVAAWRDAQRLPGNGRVELLFPDGKVRVLPLLPKTARPGWVAMKKDGGDDPDCTHGALLYARMRTASAEELWPEDYRLPLEAGWLIVRAVEGIGLCTRPGLDCEQGKWAINSVPRRMIAENLRRAGCKSGIWLAELGVAGGEQLAAHTLNPHLGIEGGISLLGTSGLVRPFSHEAYIATVRLCVRSARLLGEQTMVFCTGGKTMQGAKAWAAARREYRHLPEAAFVCIADYIAESLQAACANRMHRALVACMPGKLCKYAAGFTNTHAHRVKQDMALLRAETLRLGGGAELDQRLAGANSVREALVSMIPEALHKALLRSLGRMALANFARHCRAFGEPPAFGILLFTFDGAFLWEMRA